MAVFGVCAVNFCVVGRRTNEIGLHAAELWTNVVAPGKASDDLIGRDQASAIIDIPVLLQARSAGTHTSRMMHPEPKGPRR